MTGPLTRIWNSNQFSQFRHTSNKAISKEKTLAGYTSTMTQAFKRGGKCWANLEEKDSLIIFKDDFSSRTEPSIFRSLAPE